MTWVVTAFLFAALPHLLQSPPWIGGLVFVASVLRIVTARRNLRRPNWLVRALMTFGGLAVVAAHYGIVLGRRGAIVLLTVMLAAKLWEMVRLRDARVVASLCYFLVATQFLFSQQLLMFVYLTIGCCLATASLAVIQEDEDAPVTVPETSRMRVTAANAFALLAMATPFALVLFVLFPRLGSPLWGVPEQALDGKSGLSDRMTPGSIANLYMDDRPAFRVEFDGPRPQQSEMYWRGPVLWRFDGRIWTRLSDRGQGPERLPRPSPDAWSYQVQLEPHERRWLFTLDYPVRPPEDARLTRDFETIRERPVTTLTAYRAISEPDFVDMPRLPDNLRRVALDLPEGSNPRTREFGRELRSRFADDRELVGAVLDWFNAEPFFYSLETVPLGRDGADEFLFDLRVGYCEYYASAFAVLMRSAGIPTRVVTGYQGGFWQSGSDYLLVRHSDAHAWNEVWLDGAGWTRVDPTAAVSPARISQGVRGALNDRAGWLDAEWLFRLRNQYDRLQHLWNRWVLAFDRERQTGMLENAGLNRLPTGLRAVLLIAIAALAIVPLALLVPLLRGARDTDPLARAWARVRARLKRAGVDVQPGDTPAELRARARPALANADDLALLALEYERLRYGPEPGPEQRRGFLQGARRWRPERGNPR